MKKRYGLLAVVVCFTILVSLAACKKQEKVDTTAVAEIPTESTTQATETTAKEQTEEIKVSAISLEEELFSQVDVSVKISSADLRFPKLVGDSVQLMNINSYYENILEKQTIYFREEFYQMAQDNYSFTAENGTNFVPFMLRSDFWVSCNDENYISVVRDYEEFTGGNSAFDSVSCETFSKQSGAVLNLSDLFNIGEELYMKRLMDIVKVQANVKSDLYVNYEEILAEKFDSRNFYIVDEGGKKSLVLVYQPYDIAPGNVGIIDFSIDFEQLKDIMK